MKMIRMFMICLIHLLALSNLAMASEDLAEDISQQENKQLRKSITYLGMFGTPKPNIEAHQIKEIENSLRSGIEWGRFRFNTFDASTIGSIDDFFLAVRNQVTNNSSCREQREAKKVACLPVSDFYYAIEIGEYQVRPVRCPTNQSRKNQVKCTAEQTGFRVRLNASVHFYRLDKHPEAKKPADLFAVVERLAPEEILEFAKSARNADPNTPGPITNTNWPGQNATQKAAQNLAKWMLKKLKKIPALRLTLPIQTVVDDGVYFQGVGTEKIKLNTTLSVVEQNHSGPNRVVGFVRTRNAYPAQKDSKAGRVFAKTIKVKRKFRSTDLLVEYPLIELLIGSHFISEFVFGGFPFKNSKQNLFGAALYLDLNLGRSFGLSETYLSLQGDLLWAGRVVDNTLYLYHFTAGIKKKWFIENFAFVTGARVGIALYDFSKKTRFTFTGMGGDIFGGLEYLLGPTWSAYFDLTGRFFRNPLEAPAGEESNREFGVVASLGVRYGF